ncbi:MAG: trypsin-like peptidase domain-containing protein, partial [Armatimonadota bacterium]
HVIQGAAMINVLLGDQREVPAKLAGVDLEHDLAILRLPEGTACTAVAHSSDAAEEGLSVLATGYPFGSDLKEAGLGLTATTTRGMITAIREGKGFSRGAPMRLIQMDARVNPGNSGGPVYFPGRGEIIGVVTAQVRPAFEETGLNLAVPISYLIDLLNDVRDGRAVVPKTVTILPGTTRATAQTGPLTRVPDVTTKELPIPQERLPGGGLALKAGGGKMLADPRRPRIYVAEMDVNALAVINTETGATEKRLVIGSRPAGLALSPDDATLYVAISGGSRLTAVDLETLTIRESLQLSFQPFDVACVSVSCLYVTIRGDNWTGFHLIDPVAGTWTRGGMLYHNSMLAVHPGSPVGFMGEPGLSPASIHRCDTAVDPLKLEDGTGFGAIGSNLQEFRLSPDGRRLYVCCGAPYHVQVLSADTLVPEGQFNTGPYPNHVAPAPDGSKVFVTHGGNHVDVFDPDTFLSVGTIPTAAEVVSMVVSGDSKKLVLQFPTGVWLLDLAATTLNPAH